MTSKQETKNQETSSPKSLVKSLMSRSWCYTLNNYTPEDQVHLQAIACKYHVYGKEVGDSGTPHLQGTIIWKNAISFKSALKKLTHSSPPHIEACKAPCKSVEYCKKDDDFWEQGTPPKAPAEGGQMEKDRHKRAREQAMAGDIEDIDADLYLRYYSTLKKIKEDHMPKPDPQATFDFHWYVGPSGSGKSRRAHEENPDAYLKATNKWWDGYQPGQTVIIDEWDPNHVVLASHLKKWADHHPFCAEVKGGTRNLRPPKLIITSNYSMEECFPDNKDLLPMQRRFKVTRFGTDRALLPVHEHRSPLSGDLPSCHVNDPVIGNSFSGFSRYA